MIKELKKIWDSFLVYSNVFKLVKVFKGMKKGGFAQKVESAQKV